MIEKVVNITVTQKGTEKATQQVNKLNASLKNVEKSSGQLGNGMRGVGNTILETASSSEILNNATGGLSTTIASTVGETMLFSKSLNIVSGVQKLYTLTIGSTTGALKALRIALVTTGLGALVVLIGYLVVKMSEAKSVTDLMSEAQDKFNLILEKSNRLLKENISALEFQSKSAEIRAKILGKGEDELFQIQDKYSKKQSDLLGKNYDESYKKASDFRKNTKDILLKSNEEEAKAINDFQKKLDDEAIKARDAYYGKREERALNSLNYELSLKDKEREAQSKAKEALNKLEEDRKKAREEALKKSKEFDESVRQGQLELQYATIQAEFEQGQLKIDEALRVQLALAKIAEDQTKKEKEEADKQIEIDKEVQRQKQVIANANVNIATKTSGLLNELAGKNKALQKAGIISSAALGIYSVIKDTQAANVAAIAPPPLGLGPIAGIALQTKNTIGGALSVATIAAASAKALAAVGGGGSAGGGSVSGGGGVSAPPAPSFNLVEGTGSNQIASGLANQRQPIQAYVTSGAVTSAQQLDRNIIRDASL